MKIADQLQLFPLGPNATKAAVSTQKERPPNNGRRRQGGPPISDLTGKRFGRLVAQSMTDERLGGHVVWICKCDCGSVIKAAAPYLKRTNRPLTHCGCQGVNKNRRYAPGSLGIKSPSAKPSPLSAFNSLYSTYRWNAKKREIKWGLTKLQFAQLVSQNCHYCGASPEQVYKTGVNEYQYNGVDRVDSGKGYFAGNCVPCCGDCNRAKYDREVGDFLQWVKKIYEHQASKSDTKTGCA